MIECGCVILETLSLYLRRGTEGKSEITLSGRRCHVRDLNPTPLEYKFRVYHFTALLCRYVFSSPAILNILLVHVSLWVRYQASRPGVSLIRGCVLDIRRGSALKYSIFHSTTNQSIIIRQDYFRIQLRNYVIKVNIKWIYLVSGSNTELEYSPSVAKHLNESVIWKGVSAADCVSFSI